MTWCTPRDSIIVAHSPRFALQYLEAYDAALVECPAVPTIFCSSYGQNTHSPPVSSARLRCAVRIADKGRPRVGNIRICILHTVR